MRKTKKDKIRDLFWIKRNYTNYYGFPHYDKKSFSCMFGFDDLLKELFQILNTKEVEQISNCLNNVDTNSFYMNRISLLFNKVKGEWKPHSLFFQFKDNMSAGNRGRGGAKYKRFNIKIR